VLQRLSVLSGYPTFSTYRI